MMSPVALLVTRLAAVAMATTLLLPRGQGQKANDCYFHFSYRDGIQGSFHSPGYPEKYPEQISCIYRFEAVSNGGVIVKFDVFQLEGLSEKENQCVFDYIDVYAVGEQGYRSWMGRFCGNSLPKPINSPQSTLLIEFVSDYTKPSIGFHGVYTFLGDGHNPFPHSRVCGPEKLLGSGGIIESPNYPRPFPPRITCSWLIKVRDDEQVLLLINDLDIGTSSHCGSSDSSLEVYYGYATNNTLPNERLCGQMHSIVAARKRETVSPSSRVIIRFITGSDNRNQNKGFRLTWTAIHVPPAKGGPCREFRCEGGLQCGMEELGGICPELPRYCIHNDQRCNGIPNCGQHDDSDERRCPREILIMTALIAVPSLAVLTLVSVVIYCYRTKRVKKSTSQTQPLTSGHKQGSSSQSFNSHRSYQQCMMHTSFVDGGSGGSSGGGGENTGTLRSLGGGGGGGGVSLPISETGALPPPPDPLDSPPPPPPPPPPLMEEMPADIDDQQLQIPIPRPPDPNYRTHHKRASYTMMKQNFEDGNTVIAEI